jgi:hypothetical protein
MVTSGDRSDALSEIHLTRSEGTAVHFPLAFYDGYCADCDTERPLVLVEHGPRGLRAWLAGVGADDRALTYCCRLCGRNEHVPLTEAEDAEYDATLPTWPDTEFEQPLVLPVAATVAEPFVPVLVAVPEPVEVLPAELVVAVADPVPAPVLVAVPAPRPPVVRVISLPRQYVRATDDLPLALAVA